MSIFIDRSLLIKRIYKTYTFRKQLYLKSSIQKIGLKTKFYRNNFLLEIKKSNFGNPENY